MRRLPIFLVLDVSESMAGTAMQNLQNGINLLCNELMKDPMAMETVYISVIAFAGKAQVVTPLTYILDFNPPKLSIGSGTNLSAALQCLMKEIDTQVHKSTAEVKGDWKPLIFILTDGSPNDRYQATIRQWKEKYGKFSVVAVLMGEHSDATALSSLTSNVIVFKDANSVSFSSFFKWVSASIQMNSASPAGKKTEDDMERLRRNMDADLLADELPTENKIDYFVVASRCQKSKKPYIVRFIKTENSSQYIQDGVFTVDENYFELTGDKSDAQSLSADSLVWDAHPCPYCGNDIMGFSECNKGLCLDPNHLEHVKCPWCGKVEDYDGVMTNYDGGRG